MIRLFDQLIYNTDRNLGNLLIGKDWRLWAIDHTRAFRKHTTLKSPDYVSRCDREVFQRLKALDQDLLKRELGNYLDNGQIKALLTRRDAIVQLLEGLGPSGLFESLIRPISSRRDPAFHSPPIATGELMVCRSGPFMSGVALAARVVVLPSVGGVLAQERDRAKIAGPLQVGPHRDLPVGRRVAGRPRSSSSAPFRACGRSRARSRPPARLAERARELSSGCRRSWHAPTSTRA